MNKLKSGHCVYLEIYTHPMRVCINLLHPNLQDLENADLCFVGS